MTAQPLDVRALTVTLQQMVEPMFWGAVALAAIMPIATAAGTAVAEKFDSNKGEK